MLCNMESAAADTFEALLRASPTPRPAPAPWSREQVLDRMERAITRLIIAGECVTRADMKREAFTDGEIDQLFEIACRHALMEAELIECRGVRRARVPAGRAA